MLTHAYAVHHITYSALVIFARSPMHMKPGQCLSIVHDKMKVGVLKGRPRAMRSARVRVESGTTKLLRGQRS